MWACRGVFFFLFGFVALLAVPSLFAGLQLPVDFPRCSGRDAVFLWPRKISECRLPRARARERLAKVNISLVPTHARITGFIRFLRLSRVLKAGFFMDSDFSDLGGGTKEEIPLFVFCSAAHPAEPRGHPFTVLLRRVFLCSPSVQSLF